LKCERCHNLYDANNRLTQDKNQAVRGVRFCNLICECECHIVRSAQLPVIEQTWKGSDDEEMPY
jgi:hypothetical protein